MTSAINNLIRLLGYGHAWLLLAIGAMHLLLGIGPIQAQPVVGTLPRSEYYVARELFRSGIVVEAASGFEAALAGGRQLANQRWVDSIPPHVMLGECFYQQGNLAKALEQYDAALMIAIANPGWIDQLDLGTEQLPTLEGQSKGISWFKQSRPTTPLKVPESVQVLIDPALAQVDPQGNVVAPISVLTRLDSTEVLRTLAIALRRRHQLLGPLSPKSPLTDPVEKLLANRPRHQSGWVQGSWSILRGLSNLSTQQGLDAEAFIREGILLNSQFDYFMTPIALLAIGELEMRAGHYQAAIVTLQDATLLAAQFEQYDTLAEAFVLLGDCAAASQRVDLLESLQQASSWCVKRTPLAAVAATNGAAELSIHAANLPLTDKLCKQATQALRPREVQLPRYQARLAYNTALMAFSQDRGTFAYSQLQNALNLMRGNATTGPIPESVFQTQLVLDLLAAGNLTQLDAEEVLGQLLAEPSAAAWQLDPLKTLAGITVSSIPAYERWLRLAVERADHEEGIVRLDRLQQQRLFEALPLGGRLFSWRNALLLPPQSLPIEARQVVQGTLQRVPSLQNLSVEIGQSITELRQEPLPLDERQFPLSVKQKFAGLERASTTLENQLMLQSLSRKQLSRFLPQSWSPTTTPQTLAEGDLLLSLVNVGESVVGIALGRDRTQLWTIDESSLVEAKLTELLKEIGLFRGQERGVSNLATLPVADWRASASELWEILFPNSCRPMIANAKRLIIVPSGRMWYIPYELLIEPDGRNGESMMVQHSITYVPTIGSLSLAYQGKPQVSETVVLLGEFFTLKREENEALAKQAISVLDEAHLLFLGQKHTVPSSLWLRLRTTQLCVLSPTDLGAYGWDATVLPFDKQRSAVLSGWLYTPVGSPQRVLLPAANSSLRTGQSANGNDIFLPACALMFSGTKSALLSRWAVGGTSSSRFLERYFEELILHQNASNAMRRSVLALWSEEFLTSNEPILLPTGKDAPVLTSGNHPLIWSGYMTIGDNAP